MLRVDVSDVLFRMGKTHKIFININVLLKQIRYRIVLFTLVSSGNCVESLECGQQNATCFCVCFVTDFAFALVLDIFGATICTVNPQETNKNHIINKLIIKCPVIIHMIDLFFF